MLKHIAEFFAIEKNIRGRSAERRLIRWQRGRPLADAFQKWLPTKLGLIIQKGKLADPFLRWEALMHALMSAVSNSTTAPYHSITLNRKKLPLRRLRRAPSTAPSSLHGRNCKLNDVGPLAQVGRDGHDAELRGGTRQVALLTRSNLILNSGGFLLLRARRRQAVCLGTINGRGGYVHVPVNPGTLCV